MRPNVLIRSVLLILGSDQRVGHGTTGRAVFWKQELEALLKSSLRRGK